MVEGQHTHNQRDSRGDGLAMAKRRLGGSRRSHAAATPMEHRHGRKKKANKRFKEESMTKVALDTIGISTTLESNKSHL